MMSALQFKHTLLHWVLPLDTTEDRAAARKFHARLRAKAYADYGAPFAAGNSRKGTLLLHGSPEKVLGIIGAVPPDGEVRVIGVTDAQVGAGQSVLGAMRKAPK